MEKLTKDIFEPYTSDDELRPPMKEISLQKGYAYATNGHLLIRAKEETLDFTPQEVEGYPNAHDVIEGNIDGMDETLEIQLSDIKEALEECPKEDIHKTIECSYCNGEGYEYCMHCQNETACEECDGNGILVTDEITGHRYSLQHNIKIKNKWYKPNLWDTIATTADQLNADTLIYRHEKENINKAGLIEIGPAQILVMISIVQDPDRAEYTDLPAADPKQPA